MYNALRHRTKQGSVALQLILAACGPGEARPQSRADAWRADLQYAANELPRRHVNAFHTITRQRFAAAVKDLDAAIPTLNEDQVLVELMRLVALIGDGHTHLDLPPQWPRYAVELAWFGDELRVVAAAAPHHGALGAQVVGIGGVTVDSAMRLVSRLVPRGENERRTRLTATILLSSPQVLHGLGLSSPSRDAVLDLVTGAGEAARETLTAVNLREASGWRLATGQPPLWLRRLGEGWWVEVLPAERAAYLSFSRYSPEAEFEQRCRELGRLLDQSGVRRIVIDLRRNQGGDFTLVRRFLLPLLRDRAALNHVGGVYAIIGPGTFSAAMVNALDLRREVTAILVGEPTGARPNSYSEHGDLQLPNSGLRVSYSTRYYRFGADSATAVEPDRRIEPTWNDFRSGRDPVLDWILSQPIR